ncbi:MAG TPA: cobalamin-binding protein [Pirellulales bacterium]|nr:cobalamin-binding protein [Pirellulales bacterium]
MRIASLISSGTELVCELGLEESLVAVSHECDYPPSILGRPRVTRSRIASQASSREIDDQVRSLSASGDSLYEIDVEALVACRPDLIVTQAQCDVCAVRYADVLAAVADHPLLAKSNVLALNPQSLADVADDLDRLGEATGAPVAAERVQAAWRARLAQVEHALADLAASARPRVAMIEWLEPLMLSGNWVPEMVGLAGGRHDLTTPGEHSPYVAWDELLAYDPQAIIVVPCGFDLPRIVSDWKVLTAAPGWRGLSAVRAGRLFAVDGNALFNRPGPRLIDSVEVLAHLLHPQRVPDPAGQRGARLWARLAD